MHLPSPSSTLLITLLAESCTANSRFHLEAHLKTKCVSKEGQIIRYRINEIYPFLWDESLPMQDDTPNTSAVSEAELHPSVNSNIILLHEFSPASIRANFFKIFPPPPQQVVPSEFNTTLPIDKNLASLENLQKWRRKALAYFLT